MEEKWKKVNPVLPLDYPDPDVIRVDDTYYMVSTTMHFMPGCVILRSYNLADWEIYSYVYETLELTDQECLKMVKMLMDKECGLRHSAMKKVCFI